MRPPRTPHARLAQTGDTKSLTLRLQEVAHYSAAWSLIKLPESCPTHWNCPSHLLPRLRKESHHLLSNNADKQDHKLCHADATRARILELLWSSLRKLLLADNGHEVRRRLCFQILISSSSTGSAAAARTSTTGSGARAHQAGPRCNCWHNTSACSVGTSLSVR